MVGVRSRANGTSRAIEAIALIVKRTQGLQIGAHKLWCTAPYHSSGYPRAGCALDRDPLCSRVVSEDRMPCHAFRIP
jgi:hypothetical protein